MNTYALMTAAARSGQKLEDAGYFYVASEARFQIDKQVYPPTGTADQDPGVLKGAMNAGLGSTVGHALANDPAAYKIVAARLAKWSPKFDAGYDPGWKYANALSGAAIAPVVARVQKEMLGAMEAKVKLLDNAEYQQLANQASAVAKIESQYWNAANMKHSVAGVPEDLRKQFDQAQQRHAELAKRMKEIELATNPEARWYAQVGWKAEDYFEDAKVVALCKAIEDDNVPEMERLIAAGANANAVGKDGMTPLLWAFPDRRVARFECLLKHGADPNVVIQSDFNTKARPFHPYPIGGSAFWDKGCHAGQSVTLLAARSPMIEYLQLVMQHGGDAKAIDAKTGEAALDIVLDRFLSTTVVERVQLLVAKGAEVNRYCEYHGGYPAMEAVNNERYDAALVLLKAGADPALYQHPPVGVSNLMGLLAQRQMRDEEQQKRTGVQLPAPTPEYTALVTWLTQHGESMEAAREDEVALRKKLDGPPFGPEGVQIKMKQFVEERQKRRAAAAK